MTRRQLLASDLVALTALGLTVSVQPGFTAELGSPTRTVESAQETRSPDGRLIAFLRIREWKRPAEDSPFSLTEVRLRDTQTGEERLLVDATRLSAKWSNSEGDGFSFGQLLWSPDSQALALKDASHFFRGVVVVELATGRVFELAGTAPAWSPDGKLLALSKGTELGVNNGVLILDLNSGAISEHLLDLPVFPELSWRGSRLIVKTITDHGEELYSYDLRGSYEALKPAKGKSPPGGTPTGGTW